MSSRDRACGHRVLSGAAARGVNPDRPPGRQPGNPYQERQTRLHLVAQEHAGRRSTPAAGEQHRGGAGDALHGPGGETGNGSTDPHGHPAASKGWPGHVHSETSFSSPHGLISAADDERGRASRAGHLTMSTMGAACRAPPAQTATVCQSLLKTKEMPEIDGRAEAEATVVLGPR